MDHSRPASLRILSSIRHDLKAGAEQAKTKFRRRDRVASQFILALTANNLIRLPRLLAEAPP